MQTLRGMAAQGFSVVFISHKLDEVLEVADRISVLRRGQVVATTTPAETDRRTLARLMVGRELAELVEHPAEEPHRGRRARARRSWSCAASAPSATKDCPRCGTSISRSAPARRSASPASPATASASWPRSSPGCGRRPPGPIRIDGKTMTNRPAAEIARAGVAHIPEDRLATGLIGGMDLSENAILRDYAQPPLCSGPFLSNKAVAAFTDRLIADHDVKTPGRWAKLRTLSGGNQQKLLLARELAGQPRLIVAVHPTRGVDVGATEAIHEALREQRARGAATLLISEDLDELLALSDRIAVLFDGRVMGTLPARGADPEQIGLLMAGSREPGVGRSAARWLAVLADLADSPTPHRARADAVALDDRARHRSCRSCSRSCSAASSSSLAGENPLQVYRAMFAGALGDRNGVAETLVKTTPLLLAGLGVAVAFRMQLWNIGAEGQLYWGAIFATGLALFVIPGRPRLGAWCRPWSSPGCSAAGCGG